jgi:hypothetical protein
MKIQKLQIEIIIEDLHFMYTSSKQRPEDLGRSWFVSLSFWTCGFNGDNLVNIVEKSHVVPYRSEYEVTGKLKTKLENMLMKGLHSPKSIIISFRTFSLP